MQMPKIVTDEMLLFLLFGQIRVKPMFDKLMSSKVR